MDDERGVASGGAKRRFDEVRLGESIGPVAIGASGEAIEERAKSLVLAWSGAAHAQFISSRNTPEGVSQLSGRVFAKHMNGSRLADVQIVASAAGRTHDLAIVRVELG